MKARTGKSTSALVLYPISVCYDDSDTSLLQLFNR